VAERKTDQRGVVFVIRKLEIGGAEQQLLTLVKELIKLGVRCTVVPMYSGGEKWNEFAAVEGLTLISGEKGARWDVVKFLARFVGIVRAQRPAVVHGYMSGANELASLAAAITGATPVWGVRVSNLDPSRYVWTVGVVFKVGAFLSRGVQLVIANSRTGKDFHTASGYRPSSFAVVPNGINGARFQRDEVAGRTWREKQGIAPDARVLMLPARLDPMKGHAVFLEAMKPHFDRPDLVVVCMGDGDEALKRSLIEQELKTFGRNVIRWLPATREVVSAYSAADIVVSASIFGEGFPNVIAESMCCRCYCIATDVGDASLVLGPDGACIAPGDVQQLSLEIGKALSMTSEQLAARGVQSREYITSNFSPERLARTTLDLLEKAASARGQKVTP